MEPIRIFNKPHRSRVREAAFRTALIQATGAAHVPENFRIRRADIEKPVDVRWLGKLLAADRLLPTGRRQRCIDALDGLPDRILVALDPMRISFDFVLTRGAEEFYLEFHEEQHLSLSVDRIQSVYDAAGRIYPVPRFVQRLLRDVWRVQNYPDYSIVWHDWFVNYPAGLAEPLRKGFHEFHLPDRFTFRALCGAQ